MSVPLPDLFDPAYVLFQQRVIALHGYDASPERRRNLSYASVLEGLKPFGYDDRIEPWLAWTLAQCSDLSGVRITSALRLPGDVLASWVARINEALPGAGAPAVERLKAAHEMAHQRVPGILSIVDLSLLSSHVPQRSGPPIDSRPKWPIRMAPEGLGHLAPEYWLVAMDAIFDPTSRPANPPPWFSLDRLAEFGIGARHIASLALEWIERPSLVAPTKLPLPWFSDALPVADLERAIPLLRAQLANEAALADNEARPIHEALDTLVPRARAAGVTLPGDFARSP